jgi:hypothetical protein
VAIILRDLVLSGNEHGKRPRIAPDELEIRGIGFQKGLNLEPEKRDFLIESFHLGGALERTLPVSIKYLRIEVVLSGVLITGLTTTFSFRVRSSYRENPKSWSLDL